MSQKISMVVTDLDGTFLSRSRQTIPENVALFKRCHEQGMHIVLASGRTSSSILSYEPHLDGIDFFVVSYNGAVCLGSKTISEGTSSSATHFDRSLIFQRTVPTHILNDIIDYVIEKNIFLNVYCNGGVSAVDKPEHAPFHSLYSKHTGLSYNFVSDYSLLKNCSTPKLLMVAEPGSSMESLRAEVEAKFGEHMHIVQSEKMFLEILPKNVNKGTALKDLCETLGVPLEEVVAFGDNENDLEMLLTAGRGVCMQNGCVEVKSQTGLIVSKHTNEEAAVAKELTKLLMSSGIEI